MSLEIKGKLLVKFDTQQVSEKFKKREFVLELEEEINGNVYTNFAKMQLVQNKCDIIDRFREGDVILVSFNIKGNKWERDGKVNYITNLDAWRIESAAPLQPAPPPQPQQGTYAPAGAGNASNNFGAANYPTQSGIDDLPF